MPTYESRGHESTLSDAAVRASTGLSRPFCWKESSSTAGRKCSWSVGWLLSMSSTSAPKARSGPVRSFGPVPPPD
jgi:hypothetical protein